MKSLPSIGVFLILVLPALSKAATTQPTTEPTNQQLIDRLVDVSDQEFSVRTNIIALGSGTQMPRGARMLQESGPDPSFAMSELARRGIDALPDLTAHLDDARKTHVIITGMRPGIEYSAEYDWNPHTAKSRPKGTVDLSPGAVRPRRDLKFDGETDRHQYEVRVGDLCFNIIGRVVNRRFLSVRYQPSAIMIVNSPVLCPDLRDAVRGEWAHLTRQQFRDSLVGDVAMPATRVQVSGALAMLARDFPDALPDAVRQRMEVPTYDEATVRLFAMTDLYVEPDPAKRLKLIDEFVKTSGPGFRDGLLLQLWRNRNQKIGERKASGAVADSIPPVTVEPAEVLRQLLPDFDHYHAPIVHAVTERDTRDFIDEVTILNRRDLDRLISGR